MHGLGLEARIGVEAGEVVADESDSTFATGEAVNVAARLQQMAAARRDPRSGRSRAGSRIGAVETEEVGPVELKGFGEPLIAWRLVELLGDRRPRRLGRGAASSAASSSSSCSRTRSLA